MNTLPKHGFIPKALLVIALLLCFLPVRQAQANHAADVDIKVFHHALAPYGNWVNHRSYGRVWYPRNVPRNWRPYTDGHWAYTIEYGWLWVSDWEWGWAPFHYGRWAWDDWYGWIWVPGRVWAPAWVLWRYGGGYAAWAPMPPNYIGWSGSRFNSYYFDYDRYLGWDCWVTVHERDFHRHHLSNNIIAPQQNFQILQQTNYINNVTIINNNIVNIGIPAHQIEQATGQPVRPIRPVFVTGSNGPMKQHRRGVQDGEQVIFRPTDIMTTPETIRHEEERAKQIADKVDKEPVSNLLTEPVVKQHRLTPREPGRLTGKPAPFVQQDLPDSIWGSSENDGRPLKTDSPLLTIPVPSSEGGINRPGQSLGLHRLGLDKQAGEEDKQPMEPVREHRMEIDGRSEDARLQEKQLREQKQQEDRVRQQEEQLQQQERQQQIQVQQQAEQEKQLREQESQLRQQEEAQHRQQETERQQQMEMKRQAEQEKQLREQEYQLRQQEEAQYRQQEIERQQQMEMQRQAEQERQLREQEHQQRQQEELARRQQEEQYRQQEMERQQQMEIQQQVEQDRLLREQTRQQEEIVRQQEEQLREQQREMQRQRIQLQTEEVQPQHEQSERGRGGRSFTRSERSR